LTDSPARQCAAARRPITCAASTPAATSASVITAASDGADSVPKSPEMLSLMVSTPSRRQSRAMRRTSSGPSTGTPKLS
jgi:hypothetical protein